MEPECFAHPESVRTSAAVDSQPVLAGFGVEKEIGTIMKTEDEGDDEVHCGGVIELENV